MSPTSKQNLRAQQHLAQDHAFRELLLLRQANGGKTFMVTSNQY
jgi:hypothetical protein